MILIFIWHYCDRDVTVMTYKNEPKISVGHFCFPTDNGIWSRFSDSWFMIFGWLQNRQSHWLLFVVVFWLFPSQKMGCSTQILFNHQISCFKAMPSFYGQKNDLLKWLFFGSFLVVSHWFFGVQFPIFLFLGLWLLNFFRMLLTFFLEMFYKKHNIFFVGRGKKGSLDFLKKQFYF